MAAAHYKIDHTAQAVAHAEALYEWAESKGRGDALLALLARIFRSLKRDPIQFGDPQYNTKLPGVWCAMESRMAFPSDLPPSRRSEPYLSSL